MPSKSHCILILFAASLLTGCAQISQSIYIAGYNRDIAKYTKAVESSKDNAQRAENLSLRGAVYAEKARYSRAFKIISLDEYRRLFDLAISDLNKAIELDPASAGMYSRRGMAYYTRGTFIDNAESDMKQYRKLARDDYGKACELESRNPQDFDMLGLTYLGLDDPDHAIEAFSREAELDPHAGKGRLADAYCTKGGGLFREHKNDEAIEAYQKAVSQRASSDACGCDYYAPLVTLYQEKGDYDNAWETVRAAQSAGVYIDKSIVEKLKQH
jgi:tetratricopeptide (TPR) repeat protein